MENFSLVWFFVDSFLNVTNVTQNGKWVSYLFVFLLGLLLCLALMWCAHSFAQIQLSWGSARNNIMKVDLVTGEWRKGTPTSASLVVLSWANGGRGSLAVCQRRKPNMSRALCVVFVCRCRFRCCRCCCWVVCWVSYKVSKFLMPMAKPQNSARQPQSPFPPPSVT